MYNNKPTVIPVIWIASWHQGLWWRPWHTDRKTFPIRPHRLFTLRIDTPAWFPTPPRFTWKGLQSRKMKTLSGRKESKSVTFGTSRWEQPRASQPFAKALSTQQFVHHLLMFSVFWEKPKLDSEEVWTSRILSKGKWRTRRTYRSTRSRTRDV